MNTSLYDKIAVTVAIAMQGKTISDRHNGKVVEKVTRDILEAVREELPPLVDIQGKWEVDDPEGGVHVVFTNEDKHDREQLVYLSKFASDQGFNEAIIQMQSDLYVPLEEPKKAGIIEE